MSVPLFSTQASMFLLLLGVALMLAGAYRAVQHRRDPRIFIIYGLMHDVGVVCLGLAVPSPLASAGLWLYVLFQLITRGLALAGCAPLVASPVPADYMRLRGVGHGSAAGALFALGLLAAVGGSPFLVPEGRTLLVKGLLTLEGCGGITVLMILACTLTIFIWLSVDLVRHMVLEKPADADAGQAAPRCTTLMWVLAAATALMGLARTPIADIAGRPYGVVLEHATTNPAFAVLYLGALVVGIACLFRARIAPTIGVCASALSLVLAVAFDAPPLSRFFLIVLTLIGLVVSVYSLGYIRHNVGRYWFFLLLTFASLTGIVSADGRDALYGYWELMTFASYFLVVHEENKTAYDAGLKYYVMCAGGALFMLPGLFLLDGLAGPLGMKTEMMPWVQLGLVLTLVGLAVKAGLVPLHSWLPDAHPAAPSSVSGPLSGVITKMGIFGIVSIVFIQGNFGVAQMPGLFGLSWFGTGLVVMGAATLIYGEIMALCQDDIKRMLAYSTLGQLGEVTLVLGMGTWLATTGALWHVLNHAVMKDLLFLGAGALILRTGSRSLKDMRGLGRMMPWTTSCIAVGLVSIMGLPPFGAFYSKYLMIQAAAQAGHLWIAALILAGSLVGAIYYTRILRTLVFEERPASLPRVHEAPASMRYALAVLAVASLVLCLVPQIPMQLLSSAASYCFRPDAVDASILNALSIPWPIYVVVPIFGALIPAVLASDRKKAGWSSVIVLLLTAVLVLLFGTAMDTLSYCFAIIVPTIGAINMAYAVGYMEHSHTQWRFFAAFTCMCGALVGVAASRYLLGFFLFWEIMSSWTLYMAIAHEGTAPSLREAFKYFIFNMAGAAFIFLGICVLGPTTPFMAGLTSGYSPSLTPTTTWLGMSLLAIGFVLKAAQLPIRIDWQMHPALAPTPVSGYISSVLLKSAIVALVKLLALLGGALAVTGLMTPVHMDVINVGVMWIGAITIIYSGLKALQVNGLKLIFIYSTVSQLGYMVLAVGAGGALGWGGGMLHVINHVFFKDLLFLVCGALMFATHRETLEDLGGLGRRMPFTLAVFAIAGLSLVGVPPTSGFSSKWLIYHALMDAQQPFLALLSLLGSVITLAYVAKFLHAAFLGQPAPDLDTVRDAPAVMRVPMGILAFGCLLTGIFPGLALRPINAILAEYGVQTLPISLAGVTAGPGAWNATAIFVMAAVAFFAGRYFVLRFTHLRDIDVHTCGLPPEVATSRMSPSSVYGGLSRLFNSAKATR
ncbi:MAG: oxidoreductase [Desulfovibrio sp.]|jgi:formate hydrogenlyase subunit 3/multisubunit Na+/H+ antiporter MnhD subunit|nr:oxidoreductase [Desulfovibrio sp.]